MQSIAHRLLIAAVVVGLTAGSALAAGSKSKPKPKKPKGDPTAQATKLYNEGLEHRDAAWKLEEQAAAASGADADKLRAQAKQSYGKAVVSLRKAVELKSDFVEANSSLGYNLRKLGRYKQAMRAYDRALQLNPEYGEAIEYRAEAHLELGELEEVKSAYLKLFQSDREKADLLMGAMLRWRDDRPDQPELAKADADAFVAWIDGREEVAGQVASLKELPNRKW